MALRRTNCYEQALAAELFDKLWNSSSLKDILNYHEQLCRICSLSPTNFTEFYPKIKAKVPSWRANDLWAKIEKRSAQPCYLQGKVCAETRVLIIGAGPCGLRTAIEAQLLGAKTVVIEKRSNFSRNNVLHLWPFTIVDLRNIGAKVLYPKFCPGSIDHISIRRLQCILLKIALLIGVEVHCNVAFERLVEPQSEYDYGWKASVIPSDHPVSHFHFDVVIGADGRRSTLGGFQRKVLRAKLALAITANFIHNHTEAEARVPEISGVSYIFKQQFFQELDEAMGIALENIVYYKDETHYFVMTPTKQSLLDKGVLFQDFSDPQQLLSPENVDPEALQLFTMQAVVFATDNRLPNLQFATNSRGESDIVLFDFTTMYASENSCRAIERKGHKLLMGLVGDSLLEPFWPTGSGLGRGFLAAFDAAWMIRSWGKGLKSVCEVLAERESIHRVLNQTTHENLNKDHNQYSIDPTTRYPKINLNAVGASKANHLFDTDQEVDVFLSIRDAKRCRAVPGNVILQWFQDQLIHTGIQVNSLMDIFLNGKALITILQRYRPDLVDYSDSGQNPGDINNQCAFEILQDEFNIPIIMDGLQSLSVVNNNVPELIQYLSQVYNTFKGEIPKWPNANTHQLVELPSEVRPNCPNNAALHHSLSIKQFLKAKEELEKKKASAEQEFQRRSELYETFIQSENQPKSTRDIRIPQVLKLTPVPPGELFSMCRNGSDREKCDVPKIPADTLAKIKLARSSSDIGHRLKGFGGQGHGKGQRRTEVEETQPRIRKSKVNSNLNPTMGDLSEKTYSTFLAKHINQNSGCLTNEESDENLLSSERRLLRPTRPRSMFQNLNDQGAKEEQSAAYYPKKVQENNALVEETKSNAFFNKPEQDPEFKERCKFLEKSLYNSGRDIKVHIGTAWFQKPGGLQKSSSSVSPPGFHPLKQGNSSNTRNRMGEESLCNTGRRDEDRRDKRINPPLYGNKMAGVGDGNLCIDQKNSTPRPRNDPGSSSHHLNHPNGTSFLRHSSLKSGQGKDMKEGGGKKCTDASSVPDSDLDCFLNAIDFGSIDGQQLQELLSSY